AGIVERLPDRLHKGIAAVLARAEARVVPVGKRAGRRIGSQIGAQPLLLRRTTLAAAHHGAVTIDHNDVPGSQIIAVVAARRVTGCRTEVAEVAGCAAGEIFVVAKGRVGAGFAATPGGIITVGVFGGGT